MIKRLSVIAASLCVVAAGCAGVGEVPTAPAIVGGASSLATEQRVIGDGAITTAMLLPISGGGSASTLAQSFQNAAELALEEVGQDNVRIIVLDTGGESDQARAAAEAAISNGAQLIMGPVFSPAVAGASGPARTAGVRVIAFSTDASVTGRGVYLLSFLPRQDASRIVSFAGERGVKAFAALVPDNGYGLVMEAAFRESVASAGGRVIGVERYGEDGIDAAVTALSARGPFEALFVPGGGDDPANVARALRAQGLDARLLGSGQWDNPAVISAAGLDGSWFPGPQKGGYDAFSKRYEARFGSVPPRTASLVYDATLLANGLVGARGPGAFQAASLQSSDGFIGVDGVFRLTSDGLSQRGLAVYEVSGGTAKQIAPAPTQFSRTF
ncbi:MAG: penicillin-binding protein activator [Pseudomonadota bacterium]